MKRALVVLGCATLSACGGRTSQSTDGCFQMQMGMQAAPGAVAPDAAVDRLQQAATAASCAKYVVVESVQFGAPESAPAHSYTVTVRNDASVEVDLGDVDLQGFYSPDTAVDRADRTACGATLSGRLPAGATTNVLVACADGPASDDAYLLVRIQKNDTSFRLPAD